MYRPGPDSGSEVDGLESFTQSVSVRVEYFRSLEYFVKWKKSMYRQRSSRPRRPSEKNPLRSPSPEEEENVKLRGRRRRAGQRTANAGRGVVNTDEGSNRDIIDAIDDAQYGKRGAEEEEEADRKFVEVADKGVDESDEDCDSVNSSICSGPSILHPTTHNTRVPSQNLCSACREIYKKAKATRAPIKDKLLDNDPKSLTCDQWVLIKKLRPRRQPNARGNLLIHVKLVKKRLRKGATQIKQNKRESKSLTCSRLHTFLRRNLRRCVRAPVIKERKMNKRRKRPRDDSQGTRVAKQQRLHGHSRRQRNSKGRAHDGDIHPTSSRSRSSSPTTEACSNQKINNQVDTCVTKLIPSTVNLEKMEAKDPPSRPKMSSGFRGLLAQLRNNSSMIVKETR